MKRRLGRFERAVGLGLRWLRFFVSQSRRACDSFSLLSCIGLLLTSFISARPWTGLPTGEMTNEVIVVQPSLVALECKLNYPDFTVKARSLFPCLEADGYTFEQNPPAWPVAGGLLENSRFRFVITVKDGATL